MTERAGGQLPPDFDALYSEDPDPWGVQTTWYERRKLAVTLACLPRARYSSGWEPGCGPGVVTTALGNRVDDLVASDGSAVAVDLARQRCQHLPNVDIRQSALPATVVTKPVELVVVAECLYYVAEFQAALDTLWSAAAAGGHVLFVHWAHEPHDAFRSGPGMHADVAADAERRHARHLVAHRDQEFVLDIYENAS